MCVVVHGRVWRHRACHTCKTKSFIVLTEVGSAARAIPNCDTKRRDLSGRRLGRQVGQKAACA